MAMVSLRCPSCSWLHTAQADGVCPQCHRTIAPPHALVVPASRNEVDGLLGQRLAGAGLIVNGILALAAFAVLKKEAGDPGALRSPIASLIDFGIGVSLLTGNPRYKAWAIVRVVLGGLIFTGLNFAQHDPIDAALQVALSLSFVGLLAGTAGKVRVGVAATALVLVFALEGAALSLLGSGKNPFASSAMTASSEPLADGVLRGTAMPWKLKAPGKAWRRLKPEVARKQIAIADGWLVLPEEDAHIIVIAETVPGAARIDMDKLCQAVVGNFKAKLPDVRLVDESPLDVPFDEARLIHFQGTMTTIALEYEVGVFKRGSEIYQVQAWAEAKHFARVSSQLVSAIKSFEVEDR
jgi:hypothetical protein